MEGGREGMEGGRKRRNKGGREGEMEKEKERGGERKVRREEVNKCDCFWWPTKPSPKYATRCSPQRRCRAGALEW